MNVESLLLPLNWEEDEMGYWAATCAFSFGILKNEKGDWGLAMLSRGGTHNWQVESVEKGKELAWQIWVENMTPYLKTKNWELIHFVRESRTRLEAEKFPEYAHLLNRGWGNGYVALPKEHPCFGKSYYDIDVKVHGGLTYAEMEGDFWVVGFDTAHAFDSMEKWPKEKVEEETIRLRDQLEEMS